MRGGGCAMRDVGSGGSWGWRPRPSHAAASRLIFLGHMRPGAGAPGYRMPPLRGWGFVMRDSGCAIRDAGCGVRVLGCGMRDAGCGMRDAGCGMR